MKTYTIEFNEQQRLLFVKALQLLNHPSNLVGETPENIEESDLMLGMMKDLPECEDNLIQGFCY